MVWWFDGLISLIILNDLGVGLANVEPLGLSSGFSFPAVVITSTVLSLYPTVWSTQ